MWCGVDCTDSEHASISVAALCCVYCPDSEHASISVAALCGVDCTDSEHASISVVALCGVVSSTCSVYPGSVPIQLSLHLLLTSELHEGPPVLHPLPLFGKLPKQEWTFSPMVITVSMHLNVQCS